MSDFSNIPTGLKITSQIPLNSKEWVQNEATLAYLGVDNNLAYTYHDQLIVNCLEEKSKYIWREVQPGEENTGLIPLDFTYPLNLPETYNINYSGKTYNFFKIDLTGPQGEPGTPGAPGPQGEQGPIGPTGPQGPNISIEDGTTTIVNGDGVTTPYSVEVVNLQKTINTFPYTLTNSDDKHTIFIENGLSFVTINVPDGLVDNFSCVFIQEGSGRVTIQQSGTATLLYPSISLQNIIKDQYYWAMIEKKTNTNTYYLLGSLLPV